MTQRPCVRQRSNEGCNRLDMSSPIPQSESPVQPQTCCSRAQLHEDKATAPDEGYAVEVDSVDQKAWDDLLPRFQDASLMQTWAYGAVRWGEDRLSHVLIKRNDEVVAAAQAIIMKAPLVSGGLAYIKGGPLFRLPGRASGLESFRQVVRQVYDIYARRRRLLLRISSNAVGDEIPAMVSILEREGFGRDLSRGSERTVLVDLTNSLEELRRSLRRTWRQNLRSAEKKQLRVVGGTEPELVGAFLELYKEMQARKRCRDIFNCEYFAHIQQNLPNPLKMRISICEHKGEPVAGLIVALLGDTAMNLLAATGNKGLNLGGSYVLYWQMLEWLKERGFRWYDLGGMNWETHPGTTQFKTGFSGKLGRECSYLGRFQACESTTSYLVVTLAESLMATARMLKPSVSS